MPLHLRRWIWPLAASGLLVAAAPRPADACGGTFCDGGPTPMPVDQTGENVLFVLQDGFVEAHIQIRYDGEAAAFAWIVPVIAVPEVEVGSDPLFAALMNATVPTISVSGRTERRCPSLACAAKDARTEGNFDDSGGPDGPDVVARGIAGSFEYAVLEGGTLDGVVQWLDDNGYAQDEDAPSALQEYLDEGFVFVAFKLSGGADVDEIHPVVLRYPGAEPCVPIRLTRIAAVEDMGIRVFFLGDLRVVPSNYRHVVLNFLKLDWLTRGSNYEELVTLAVDDEGADGHAFVTEYAGTSSIVDKSGVFSAKWSSQSFVGIEAPDVTDELVAQELLTCDFGLCTANHPLIAGLLREYFPTPAGRSDGAFWANLDAELDQAAIDAFDSYAFADDLETRVIAPGEHANELLAQLYLTRMYTTISPDEMTIDPLFHEVDDLPDVSNQLGATQIGNCKGETLRVELDDGRTIEFGNNVLMPEFADMPWAARVEQFPPAGAPMTIVDHNDDIDAMLEDWNAGHDSGCSCRIDDLHLDDLVLVGLVALGLRARRRGQETSRAR